MSIAQSNLTANDLLFVVRSIQGVRELVQPLLFAARDEERRIANLDHEGIVHPDTDLAALDAAEAVTQRYGNMEAALRDSIFRLMGNRNETANELTARLERDARAEFEATQSLPTYRIHAEDFAISYRIHAEDFAISYRVATEEEALDAFARDAGYRDYAELAGTLGKTVDEAKAELVIDCRRSVRDLAERARKASSLMRLWQALDDYVEGCREQYVDCEQAGLDFTDLPTFGGEAPANLPNGSVLAVLSWDETHLLIQTRNSERPYVVAPRSAYA
ncbi:hypothetical protein ACUXK4_004491 [Methylorubrum extorquens]